MHVSQRDADSGAASGTRFTNDILCFSSFEAGPGVLCISKRQASQNSHLQSSECLEEGDVVLKL